MRDFDKQMEMVLYHSDEGDVSVDAYIMNDSLWITQKAMAELFGVDKSGISRHLKKIFESGELDEKVVVAKIATTSPHVETVCLLSKLHEAKHHINVKLDMDELNLTSAEAKATYKEIAEKYGLISCIAGEPIGFVTWDPRNRPEYVEIGHNGIREKYKRQGYGHRQLEEAIRRIKEYEGLKRIIVCTNSNLAAPKNYESVGFTLYDRKPNDTESAYTGDYLYYEIVL